MKIKESIEKIIDDREERRKKALSEFSRVSDKHLELLIRATEDHRHLNLDEKIEVELYNSWAKEEMIRRNEIRDERSKSKYENIDQYNMPIKERLWTINDLKYGFLNNINLCDYRDYKERIKHYHWLKSGKPTKYWGDFEWDSEKMAVKKEPEYAIELHAINNLKSRFDPLDFLLKFIMISSLVVVGLVAIIIIYGLLSAIFC